jgi:hypothetical protein
MKRSATAALLGALLILAAPVTGARAEAVSPVQGPWSGTTSVGLPVTFQVKEGDVVDAHFGFNWGFCGHYESHLPNTDPIDAEGHWSFEDSRGQTITGAFVAPDRVEGTVVAVERMLPGCPATHATFLAIPGAAPPPVAPQVFAVQNAITGHQSRSPREITLRRGLAFYLWGLNWQDYGQNVAHATGRASIRHFKREWNPRASVRLSSLIPDGPGKRLYSQLHYSLSGPLPAHFPRQGSFRFHHRG